MPIRVSKTRVDFEDNQLIRPILRDYGEIRIAENSGATYTIDLTRSNVYEITLTANCTFTFSNPSPAGNASSFTLILVQDGTGSRLATWPTSVDWHGGTAPTLTTAANAVDIITFLTTDGGVRWYGFVAGQDMK